jgi:hypothetical protein
VVALEVGGRELAGFDLDHGVPCAAHQTPGHLQLGELALLPQPAGGFVEGVAKAALTAPAAVFLHGGQTESFEVGAIDGGAAALGLRRIDLLFATGKLPFAATLSDTLFERRFGSALATPGFVLPRGSTSQGLDVALDGDLLPKPVGELELGALLTPALVGRARKAMPPAPLVVLLSVLQAKGGNVGEELGIFALQPFPAAARAPAFLCHAE